MMLSHGVTLTLDNVWGNGTSFIDNAAILSVDDGDTLTLSGVTINGGTINDGTPDERENSPDGDEGVIKVTGSSTIEGNASLNNGFVTLSSGVTLTLDNVTVVGTTFNDTAVGAILVVDLWDTLTLSGATINGGTVTDHGNIDIAGNSSINNAALNGGYVTVENGETVTLSNTTVTGTTFAGSHAAINI